MTRKVTSSLTRYKVTRLMTSVITRTMTRTMIRTMTRTRIKHKDQGTGQNWSLGLTRRQVKRKSEAAGTGMTPRQVKHLPPPQDWSKIDASARIIHRWRKEQGPAADRSLLRWWKSMREIEKGGKNLIILNLITPKVLFRVRIRALALGC